MFYLPSEGGDKLLCSCWGLIEWGPSSSRDRSGSPPKDFTRRRLNSLRSGSGAEVFKKDDEMGNCDDDMTG